MHTCTSRNQGARERESGAEADNTVGRKTITKKNFGSGHGKPRNNNTVRLSITIPSNIFYSVHVCMYVCMCFFSSSNISYSVHACMYDLSVSSPRLLSSPIPGQSKEPPAAAGAPGKRHGVRGDRSRGQCQAAGSGVRCYLHKEEGGSSQGSAPQSCMGRQRVRS